MGGHALLWRSRLFWATEADVDFKGSSSSDPRLLDALPLGRTVSLSASEWLAVRREHLCLIPEGVDDVSATGIPVAYLTAHMALTLAGLQPGKTVLAPAIGGSVGNALTQLARALAEIQTRLDQQGRR
jgi:hypothetical protein